jgi:hypothetical protein
MMLELNKGLKPLALLDSPILFDLLVQPERMEAGSNKKRA